MSPVPTNCPHDIRPGTTVCLHCRKEAQLEASARVRQLIVRGAVTVAVIGVVAVAGVAAAGAMRSSRAGAAPAPVVHGASMQTASMTPVSPAPEPSHPDSLLAAAGVRTDSGLKAVEPGTAPEPPAALTAALAPTIAEGRTELGGGVYAERSGDTVVVHFDTPMTRTRRAEKFAGVVRSTLPRVFGGVAESLLASAPSAAFERSMPELTDPSHPIHLGTLTLWGETRPGQDGPLLVSYRAVVGK